MKQRFMILGAGIYQVPLINKAREMGLEVIVVSPQGPYPGIPIADTHLEIDTTDADKIVNAAEDMKISGIATTGTDVCVPSIGRVVDKLGLAGTGYKAACKSMDKVLMKESFLADSVPTASFNKFKSKALALEHALKLKYPVMVKATDSSGSRGITKVNHIGEFEYAWDRAFNVSRSKEIIVEEYLVGYEFGAQAFIQGDQVVAVFPHGDTVTPAPFFSPIGHSMPTQLSDEQQTKTFKVVEQAVYSLGIRDCVANVDLMLVEGEPKLIEIGARMGATCLPENISIYSGMDVYKYLILLALGERPVVSVTTKQANASLLLRSPKTGSLIDIVIPNQVKEHPLLLDLQIDVKPCDNLRKFEVGPDRIGHLIVKADNANAAETLAQELADNIHFEVKV